MSRTSILYPVYLYVYFVILAINTSNLSDLVHAAAVILNQRISRGIHFLYFSVFVNIFEEKNLFFYMRQVFSSCLVQSGAGILDRRISSINIP